MNIKTTRIIVSLISLLIMPLSVSFAQNEYTATKMFVEMPDSLLPYMKKQTREELVELKKIDRQGTPGLKNTFETELVLTKLSDNDDILEITTEENITMEIGKLSDERFVFIKTCATPEKESKCYIYNNVWELQEEIVLDHTMLIKSYEEILQTTQDIQQTSNNIQQNSKDTHHSSKEIQQNSKDTHHSTASNSVAMETMPKESEKVVYSKEEYLNMLDLMEFPLVEAHLGDTPDILILRLNAPMLNKEEKDKFNNVVKEVKFVWNGMTYCKEM